MPFQESRRDVLKLLGVGGIICASGLAGAATSKKKSSVDADFFFLQLSDTHWGYSGPSNPEADVTLKHAVETINGVSARPDFIVFTGDLTHTTNDGAVRRQRMREFKQIVSPLGAKLYLMPGEHDAAPDAGRAFEESFGATHYSFDHKGVHFVTLDNVSDPAGAVGSAQIDWLSADLKRVGREVPIVVLTHRPLFDLYPEWDWSTKDGAKVVDLLLSYPHVTVFYGHIHQQHHHQTAHIAHHAARSLIFPLPPPGSVGKKAPLAWNSGQPFAGLGHRRIDVEGPERGTRFAEVPLAKNPA